jgi:hypothetical protein
LHCVDERLLHRSKARRPRRLFFFQTYMKQRVIIAVMDRLGKVPSCYDSFAYFSNSFISGESMVIAIELNQIF